MTDYETKMMINLTISYTACSCTHYKWPLSLSAGTETYLLPDLFQNYLFIIQ